MTFPDPIRLQPRPGREADARLAVDPFTRLSSDAHPLRAYLGRLDLVGRTVVPHLTVLVEPNEYPRPRSGSARPPVGQGQLARIWEQGLRHHRALRSDAVVAIEERALPGTPDVPRHPPLFYCLRTGAYGTPRCPSCLGELHTCRDEALLRRCGLPSHEASLDRFLHCAACGEKSRGEKVFYTFSLDRLDGVAADVTVRRRSELYRDLGARITGTEEAIADHPCATCEHRPTCYPAGRHVDDRLPAEDLLFPLAYYDFHWLPLEPLPLDFRETVALLGGARPADVDTLAADLDQPTPLRQEVLRDLDRAGRQFFFAGDAAGLFHLEALYLKLIAMAGLVGGALDHLVATGHAHLALTPDRIRGQLVPGAASMPDRWGLVLKIGDLLTAAPPLELDAGRVADEPTVVNVPYPCPEAFLPDAARQPQIETLWMRLALEDLQIDTAGARPRATMRARLTAPDLYRADAHGGHDLVRVELAGGPAGDQRLVFAGTRQEAIPGGFTFAGATAPLDEQDLALARTADQLAAANVEVTIAHVFAAPADVLSLGLLLLRMVLSNDAQSVDHVDARQAQAMAEAAAGGARAGDQERRQTLAAALASGGLDADPASVLHRQDDRQAVAAAIPADLWDDVLDLALRMASSIEGYSICARQDHYDGDDPAAPLRRVLQALTDLAARARGSLVGSAGRNTAVQVVCSDFLADLKQAREPAPEAGGADFADQTYVSPSPPPPAKPSP